MGGEICKEMHEGKHINKFLKIINSHLTGFQHSWVSGMCQVPGRGEVWSLPLKSSQTGWCTQGHAPGTEELNGSSALPKMSENWLWRMGEVGHIVKWKTEVQAKGAPCAKAQTHEITVAFMGLQIIYYDSTVERGETAKTIMWMTVMAW